MVKKLKKWRDNLSYEQANAIFWSVEKVILVCGLILGIVSVFDVMQLKWIPIEDVVVFAFAGGLLFFILDVLLLVRLNGLLQLDDKEREAKAQDLKKFYCETFEKKTEVVYKGKEAPEGDAGEMYWDMKHCEDPHFFAQWQEDESIYLELEDGDQLVRSYDIGNMHLFDNHFKIN